MSKGEETAPLSNSTLMAGGEIGRGAFSSKEERVADVSPYAGGGVTIVGSKLALPRQENEDRGRSFLSAMGGTLIPDGKTTLSICGVQPLAGFEGTAERTIDVWGWKGSLRLVRVRVMRRCPFSAADATLWLFDPHCPCLYRAKNMEPGSPNVGHYCTLTDPVDLSLTEKNHTDNSGSSNQRLVES